MKKIILFISIVTLVACKPKAVASKSTPSAAPSTEPTEVQLAAAKEKFPDATMDVLKKGHSIYYGACTRCHGAKSIDKRGEAEWVSILDDMAPKAKLTDVEKDAVWKYIMAVKLSAKK